MMPLSLRAQILYRLMRRAERLASRCGSLAERHEKDWRNFGYYEDEASNHQEDAEHWRRELEALR